MIAGVKIIRAWLWILLRVFDVAGRVLVAIEMRGWT
jgi:hypothetical protein